MELLVITLILVLFFHINGIYIRKKNNSEYRLNSLVHMTRGTLAPAAARAGVQAQRCLVAISEVHIPSTLYRCRYRSLDPLPFLPPYPHPPLSSHSLLRRPWELTRCLV